MRRLLPKLNSVPTDHTKFATSWVLGNNFNSDSVVETRQFVAGSSIAIRVINSGCFVKVTVGDGVSELSQNLVLRESLIVQTSGLGDHIVYSISVKGENLTNKLTAGGAALSLVVNVFTLPEEEPIVSTPTRWPVLPSAPSLPATSESPKTHMVMLDEYLRLIAQQEYGDANKWKIIYNANRGLIGPNPNLILSGRG
jgi:nucleoid-associated protein YgaU